jgi:drug/metabolite transporter (DMT)-like permease
MVISTALFMSSNAMVRHITGSVHPFEVAFFRSILGALALLPWCLAVRIPMPSKQIMRMYLLRGGINSLTILLSFMALSLAPLAEVTAINFSAPLFATVAAVFLLKERIKWFQPWGMAFGFIGIVLILRPGAGVINPGVLLMLVNSVIIGFVLILIKKLSQVQSSLAVTTISVSLQSPIVLLAALPFWHWPTTAEWPWLLGMALTGSLGQLINTQAIRDADLSTIMPFDFSKLLWAGLIGYVVFGEFPDAWTWIGGSLIFASSTWVVLQEVRSRQQMRVTPLPPLGPSPPLA